MIVDARSVRAEDACLAFGREPAHGDRLVSTERQRAAGAGRRSWGRAAVPQSSPRPVGLHAGINPAATDLALSRGRLPGRSDLRGRPGAEPNIKYGRS